MKSAFTIIEVIFVIVILGILAAVAIPRLNATRDDATNVALAQNIMTGTADIASYSISNGGTNADLTSMSDALKGLVNRGVATKAPSDRSVSISRGGVSDCVVIYVDKNTTTETLILTLGAAAGDEQCLDLQRIIHTSEYPILLKGDKVVY